jgi:hypothetical protein
MVCDINRSISIGILTTVVMSVILILWVGYDNIKNSNINASQILLLVALLFVIGTSMDYFNQCYTTCNNSKTSLAYGLFTVSMIYIFYSLFIKRVELTGGNLGLFVINVLIISLLHNVTCSMVPRV